MCELDKCNDSFKEAVCIEAQRIFDSCSDKDCIENLELTFANAQAYTDLETAAFIKTRCIEVISTFFSIEPVPFNKGFYAVDITYTLTAEVEIYQSTCTAPTVYTGTTTFNKKVILYGSDGNTKYFRSTDECGAVQQNGCASCFTNLPTATVSVVEPICLDCKIVCRTPCTTPPICCSCGETTALVPCPPEQSAELPARTVVITIGMFSIVSLSRPVPILIPAYDYCIPHKECSSGTSDTPCELFDKIDFPTREFFPKSLREQTNSNYSCGCNSSSASYE